MLKSMFNKLVKFFIKKFKGNNNFEKHFFEYFNINIIGIFWIFFIKKFKGNNNFYIKSYALKHSKSDWMILKILIETIENNIFECFTFWLIQFWILSHLMKFIKSCILTKKLFKIYREFIFKEFIIFINIDRF